jgi:hypothetical protein
VIKRSIILLLLALATIAQADSEGPLSPTAATDQGDWTDETNVFSSNNLRARDPGTNSHILRAYTFGFAIPAGATINGFLVSVEGYGVEPNPERREIEVALGVSGYTPTGSWKAGTLPLDPAEAYIDFGSSSDLWGGTWAVGDANNVEFSVLVRQSADGTIGVNFVDHIRVTVTYTPAAGGAANYRRRIELQRLLNGG